jgi:uncharacterized membrane protein YoaT (DUF817 family)
MVSYSKLGSWFLLMIISYTLVSLVNAPRPDAGKTEAAPGRDEADRRAA